MLNAFTVLECGTSLGVNSLYLEKSEGVSRVITIEGSPIVSALAQKGFNKYAKGKIHLISGNIYDVFVPQLIKNKPQIIFIDADHRGSAIDFYLSQIKMHHPDVDCVIIHDLYWSADMKLAWKKVIADSTFKLTIDLFHAGLIFPNRDQPKQHFTLKF
jgi:predicted O-methyltransferase YrrM